MTSPHLFCLLAAAAISATPLAAEPLPATATPLSAADVTALYSGNSTEWSNSSAFFRPDKTVIGVYGENLDESIYWGKWTVTGNEICMRNSWRNVKNGDTGGGATDCWMWYETPNGTLYTLWSTRFDGTKPPKDDYYTGEVEALRKGDIVSRQYAKLSKSG